MTASTPSRASALVAPAQAASAPGAQPRDVEVEAVSKAYGEVAAVADVSFTLAEGEFLTLLGPSGSGKTTTLLMVAGFERPSAGDIRVAGRSVINEPPHRRNLGIVFQGYALFPHMSVGENVEFPLRMRRVSRKQRRVRAQEMLEKVGLSGLASRRPRELSGGQQQRVALARALVFEPDALLLDEPLGALDKRLREQLQLEIKELHSRTGISVLYVTHDQEEAMTMSDRIGVMRDGRLAQLGSPAEVYHAPHSPFVAHFLGETNLLSCTASGGAEGHAEIVFADGTRGLARRPETKAPAGAEMVVSIRPERVAVLQPGHRCENEVEAVVVSRTFAGSHTRYTFAALGQELAARLTDDAGTPNLRAGQAVRLGWAADAAQLLVHEQS